MRLNAAFLAYLAGFINAVGAALVTFNVVLTQTQLSAIGACVNAAMLLIAAAIHGTATATAAATPKGAGGNGS